MTTFMNTRSPVFRGQTAPRSTAVPMPTFGPGWKPSRISINAAGRRVLQFGPRLTRFNPATVIAGLVIEKVAREALQYYFMSMNGYSLVQYCDPFVSASRYTGSPAGACVSATGQNAGNPLSSLLSSPTAPGPYIALIGPKAFVPTTSIPTWRTNSTWLASGVSVGGVRARPFFGPIAPPTWVPSVAAVHAPPRHVPWDVKPWPVWGKGNAPSAPSPTPSLDTGEGPIPGIRWSWGGYGQPARVQRVDRVNTPSRVVTRPMEREVKIGANTAAGQFFFNLMKAREAVSEIMDIFGVLFDALPKHTRARYGGATASDHDKMRAVFENLENIDAGLFLAGLVQNQIEDEIIGRTWFKARGDLRNKIFGDTIGSLGPVANGAFLAYATAVSDLAKGITDGIFGQQGHEYDRRMGSLLKNAETKLRALRKAANHSLSASQGNSALKERT